METDDFLKELILIKPEYTPFTEGINENYFYGIEMRLIEVEQWDTANEIERDQFESLISNNKALANAYVDLFTTSFRYFVSEMDINNITHEFYMIISYKRIALIFFRRKDPE